MASQPRIALVLECPVLQASARLWLARGYELVVVRRGRHLAADLAAARADATIVEAVHPSEAAWLVAWLRTQPKLSRMKMVVILPFGPIPKTPAAGVAFVPQPVARASLLGRLVRLLRPTPNRDRPS